ncbi:hypothetical protein J0S82_012669, partial [Galemys pyrenaicus]
TSPLRNLLAWTELGFQFPQPCQGPTLKDRDGDQGQLDLPMTYTGLGPKSTLTLNAKAFLPSLRQPPSWLQVANRCQHSGNVRVRGPEGIQAVVSEKCWQVQYSRRSRGPQGGGSPPGPLPSRGQTSSRGGHAGSRHNLKREAGTVSILEGGINLRRHPSPVGGPAGHWAVHSTGAGVKAPVVPALEEVDLVLLRAPNQGSVDVGARQAQLRE